MSWLQQVHKALEIAEAALASASYAVPSPQSAAHASVAAGLQVISQAVVSAPQPCPGPPDERAPRDAHPSRAADHAQPQPAAGPVSQSAGSLISREQAQASSCDPKEPARTVEPSRPSDARPAAACVQLDQAAGAASLCSSQPVQLPDAPVQDSSLQQASTSIPPLAAGSGTSKAGLLRTGAALHRAPAPAAPPQIRGAEVMHACIPPGTGPKPGSSCS